MKDCVFCKIIDREIEGNDILFEDDNVLVMLDVDWAVKGHTLVIWKEHLNNVSDLSRQDFTHFSEIARRTEKALLEELNLDKSAILKSGGIVSHFHFHIYPLRKDISWQEVKDIFDKNVRYEVTTEERDALIKSLKKQLQERQ